MRLLRKNFIPGVYWLSVGWDCLRGSASQSVHVLGYSKSGTNWLCRLLSSILGIPLSPGPPRWRTTGPGRLGTGLGQRGDALGSQQIAYRPSIRHRKNLAGQPVQTPLFEK